MFNPKVSQAVAAALALGVTAGAQAAPPAPVTLDQVPPGNILYVTGSTAVSPVLDDYIINSSNAICDKTAATPVVYTGTEPGVEFNAVSCIASDRVAGSPLGTEPEIAIIKENNGESKNGILAVSAPTSNFVTYPDLRFGRFAGHCTLAARPVTSPGLVPYYPATCDQLYPAVTSTATTGPYAALSYSDVEAAIFGLNPTNVGKSYSVDMPFGIVVSLGLYHALQGAEGLPEDDSLADMPNLTRGQLASIFEGVFTDWAYVHGAGTGTVGAQSVHFGNSGLSGPHQVCYDGTANSTASDCQSGTQASIAHTPANTAIYFCELGQSSGTQAAIQIFFSGQGCIAAPTKFQPPTRGSCIANGCAWGATYASDQVFGGNGQRDDLACLEAHDQQGEFAISYASTAQEWGSVAVTAGNQNTADWRFIRVGGYAPSMENIAADKYELWAQSTFYYATAGVNLPTGVELLLLQFFTNPATQIGGIPVNLSTADIDYALERSNPTLDGGILAIPLGGLVSANPYNATLPTFRSNPVNGYLRNNPGNSCQQPFASVDTPDLSDAPAWDPKSIQ